MEIRKLTLDDVAMMAELESNTYSEEMCLGFEDYYNDLESTPINHSVGVFSNDVLKAFICCYYDLELNSYYVSDIICKNPKYLILLLKNFKNLVSGLILHAEFRVNSFKMLQKIIKLFPNTVEIINYEFEEDYYYKDEHVYFCEFLVK